MFVVYICYLTCYLFTLEEIVNLRCKETNYICKVLRVFEFRSILDRLQEFQFQFMCKIQDVNTFQQKKIVVWFCSSYLHMKVSYWFLCWNGVANCYCSMPVVLIFGRKSEFWLMKVCCTALLHSFYFSLGMLGLYTWTWNLGNFRWWCYYSWHF